MAATCSLSRTFPIWTLLAQLGGQLGGLGLPVERLPVAPAVALPSPNQPPPPTLAKRHGEKYV